MESKRYTGDKAYWPKLKQQVHFLTERTLLIWFCGILFTKLATDVWLGPRPVVVGVTLLLLVYSYMHLGYYLTAAIRAPIAIMVFYLVHVHLINSGDFLLKQSVELSWSHFFTLWLALNFSFLFRTELYPFCTEKLHLDPSGKPLVSPESKPPGKVIDLPLRAAKGSH